MSGGSLTRRDVHTRSTRKNLITNTSRALATLLESFAEGVTNLPGTLWILPRSPLSLFSPPFRAARTFFDALFQTLARTDLFDALFQTLALGSFTVGNRLQKTSRRTQRKKPTRRAPVKRTMSSSGSSIETICAPSQSGQTGHGRGTPSA